MAQPLSACPTKKITVVRISGVVRGAAAGRKRGGSGAVAMVMSGRQRRHICAGAAEWHWWRRGIGSGASAAADADALLGLRCSARLESLGSLCSARVRVCKFPGAATFLRKSHK
jgi:hypothetical protein